MTLESPNRTSGVIENIFPFTNTKNKFQVDSVSTYFENTI
jgi:hypothetical protein